MKSMRFAIVAMAFATLAPFAQAAEGQGDNAEKQPTMAELKAKMNAISAEIAALAATVANLAGASSASTASIASKVDALAATVTANHTIIVGRFARQMAVVMTVPKPPGRTAGYDASYYLVGNSSIPGFPSESVTNGVITWGPNRHLPAGTYLFELQQPYSGNVLCNRSVSRRQDVTGAGGKFNSDCPRIRLQVQTLEASGSPKRLDDGFGIYTMPGNTSFTVLHKFPTGFAFTDDKPLGSYSGAVRITKLK